MERNEFCGHDLAFGLPSGSFIIIAIWNVVFYMNLMGMKTLYKFCEHISYIVIDIYVALVYVSEMFNNG